MKVIELYRAVNSGNILKSKDGFQRYVVSRVEGNRLFGYRYGDNYRNEMCIAMDMKNIKGEITHLDGARIK